MCGSKRGLLIVIALLMTGCAAFTGYPDKQVSNDSILGSLESIMSSDNIRDCIVKNMKACRDEIIYTTILSVDINYDKFITSLTNEDKDISFITTVTTLGLSTAASLYGGHLLSGVSSLIIGSKAGFDNKVLIAKAISTLLNAMNGARDTIKTRLITGIGQSIENYPMQLASIDLQEYYQAGTLMTAYTNLSVDSGVKADVAKKELDTVLRFKYVKTPNSEILKRWLLKENSKPDTEHIKQLSSWLSTNKIDAHTASFINASGVDMDALRAKAIVDLNIAVH